MNSEPLISVIIPVYNTAPLLPRCLDSVLQNTYRNLEVICVNDGSTDESISVLQSYAERDSRLVIITQENRGLAMARNAGLDRAGGDYLAFVDSDDCVHPQYFEIMAAISLHYNADITACTIERTEIGKAFSCRTERIEINDIYKNCQIFDGDRAVTGRGFVAGGGMSKLLRSELVKKIRFQNEIAIEDIPFFLEAVCAKSDIRCVYIPLNLYFYIRQAGSLSTRLTLNDEYAMAVYFYNNGIDAAEAHQDRRAYALFLHAMKRSILLRYRCMFNSENKAILHQFTKSCLKEYLALHYPGHYYEKVRYTLLANSPLLYHIGHLLKKPTDLQWELAGLKQSLKK